MQQNGDHLDPELLNVTEHFKIFASTAGNSNTAVVFYAHNKIFGHVKRPYDIFRDNRYQAFNFRRISVGLLVSNELFDNFMP